MSRAKTMLIAGATLVALAGAASYALVAAPGRSPESAKPAIGAATAEVTKGDLTEDVRVRGTLGFAATGKVIARTAGVLTWLPDAGSPIKRNGRLYEVGGKPVRLMYGRKPMYRELRSGDEGADVRQLESNLKALGHGEDLTVDDEYTWVTARAVREWQADHDLPETGTIGPDQIAFTPGAVRVQEQNTSIGMRIGDGTPLMTVTSADREVTFKLDVSDAAKLRTGARVGVELPDGKRVKGRITGIGRTAQVDEQATDKTPKVEVMVEFDDSRMVKGVDKAPVTVQIRGETREDVLSVPITALLVMNDGGFGVRVVEKGGAREVRVELGLFAGGRVEVTGAGLGEGMKVEVPGA